MVQRVIILQLTTPLPFKIYSTCNGELVVGYLLALLTLALLLTLVHSRALCRRCQDALLAECGTKKPTFHFQNRTPRHEENTMGTIWKIS